MVWTSLAKSAKVDSPATKISKAWILYRSRFGSSYIKDYTILGFVVLPTAEKLSSSHLTTLALQYLLQNWFLNYVQGMWIWTNWQNFKSRSAGQFVNQKEATQNMAKEVAQLLQSWLPAQPSADNASQQRILELEAELAKMKSDSSQHPPTAPEAPGNTSTPIGRALQGQPSASTSFDPSSLLVSPGSVNPWLVDNQPSSLTETQYKKWLKDLKLPQHKQDVLEKQLEKVMEWWRNQPDDTAKTIQRASVAMGIDPCKHKNASTDEIVLKVMTVAMLIHS